MDFWCRSKELLPSAGCRFCPAVCLAAGQAQLAPLCKLSGWELVGAAAGLHSRWEAGCGGRHLGIAEGTSLGLLRLQSL